MNSSDIIVLLDESGSMSTMGKEPIQALNSFITEQKKIDASSALFSLYTFNNKVTSKQVDIPLQDVTEIGDYSPNGTTALFDAIATAVTKAKERKNVVLVIITDGHDNASAVATREMAVQYIKDQEKNNNWQVLYLAGNQDAFKSGSSLNISRTKMCMFNQCQSGSLRTTLDNVCQSVSVFRRSTSECVHPENIVIKSTDTAPTLQRFV